MEEKPSRKRKRDEMVGAQLPDRPRLTKMRRTPASDLILFLGRQLDSSHLLHQTRRSRLTGTLQQGLANRFALKIRREHPLPVQALVIFLRFGSLSSDEQTFLSPMDVFRRTGIKMTS